MPRSSLQKGHTKVYDDRPPVPCYRDFFFHLLYETETKQNHQSQNPELIRPYFTAYMDKVDAFAQLRQKDLISSGF